MGKLDLFMTVDDAVSFFPKNGFMVNIDLSGAYRSIPIHLSCYQLMGLSWIFEDDTSPTYIVDTHLPFRASKSPEIFQRISSCIARYMKRLGFTVISYLDDFFIIHNSKAACQKGYEYYCMYYKK